MAGAHEPSLCLALIQPEKEWAEASASSVNHTTERHYYTAAVL